MLSFCDFIQVYVFTTNHHLNVYSCIWPRVMVSDRRDWISLKFIWHMISNKTQVEFKKGGYMSIWTGVSLSCA